MPIRLRHIFLTLFILLSCANICADEQWSQITLSSGVQYEGKITMQNEDVIVFSTSQGRTYQFPKSQVVSIEDVVKQVDVVNKKTYDKLFGIMIHIDGGVSAANQRLGSHFGGGLQAGVTNLFDKHIFLGGGVGVDIMNVGGVMIFVPLKASIEVPLLSNNDTPFIGVDAGYGFAAKGAKRGGFAGGIKLGWLHRFESRNAISLALYANMQRAQINVVENIYNTEYQYTAYRIIPQIGVRFAVQL